MNPYARNSTSNTTNAPTIEISKVIIKFLMTNTSLFESKYMISNHAISAPNTNIDTIFTVDDISLVDANTVSFKILASVVNNSLTGLK